MKTIHQDSLIQLLSRTEKEEAVHSSSWVKECGRLSGIRREKVYALRQALANGTWHPDPAEITSKLLYEYLCY
jgi:anti-sigma28 factor (negative regulator of flagellin synthesis)